MGDEFYLCRLYLVSPPSFTPGDFAKQLEAALQAGDVGAFQLRLKEASDPEIMTAAATLIPICHERGVAFILNDRVDLVRQAGADGVHLGQDDMSVKEARGLLGADKIIGVSCHDSMHMAMEAGEASADYVAFGAFHPTQSKSPEKLAKYGTPAVELLERWSSQTTVPCVAIGGMTPDNCGPMVEAGADFIAAITSVWSHKDGPTAAVKAFNMAIKQSLKKRKPEAA